MSPKILIAVIVVLLMAMPFTHYRAYKQGRVSMKQEATKIVAKGAFVFNGDIRYLERVVQHNMGTCGICHIEGDV